MLNDISVQDIYTVLFIYDRTYFCFVFFCMKQRDELQEFKITMCICRFVSNKISFFLIIWRFLCFKFSGNCTCENGYAGSDCSFDLLGPPAISHISDFGFCDKSKEACDEITLFGKYFIENMNTNCFMTRHTVKKHVLI